MTRATPGSRIVHMSSGAGLLTLISDPAFGHRSNFGPIYPGCKAALNAVTAATTMEQGSEGIPVNAVAPGLRRPALMRVREPRRLKNARQAVRVAPLGRHTPTGKFTRWEGNTVPW
ncbi:SDR family oxidoreductase [Agrobacterium vitis]|uniref:SDR family oxidoreductase n=1 Tax=Agrobacterium vitis TaxID=373 RepID=UPI003D2A6EAF